MHQTIVLSVALILALPHFAEGFSSPLLLRSPGQLSQKSSCWNQLSVAQRARSDLRLQMRGSVEEKTEVAKDLKASSEEEKPEKENLMTKVKAAGIAGLISYAAWEFVFWTVSVPVAIYGYHQTTGQWPSFDNPESTAKVSAEIFVFLNIARALVPVRIGLTLATTPLVDKYICTPLGIGKDKDEEKDA